MGKSSSLSWKVIRLGTGEKHRFDEWSLPRAMFVVDGEVRTVSGYRKGVTVGRGEMTLVHAVRSRTVVAQKESLVIVSLFDSSLNAYDAKLADEIVEVLRDAAPFDCGSDIKMVLGQVRVFMDAGGIKEKLDGVLRSLLIDKLHTLLAAGSCKRIGSCPVSCNVECDSCNRSTSTPAA